MQIAQKLYEKSNKIKKEQEEKTKSEFIQVMENIYYDVKKEKETYLEETKVEAGGE